jgi:putative flippase GtrA
MRSIKKEVLRFVAVGVVNTGITYLLYLALLRIVPYILAYSLVFLIGIVISYYLNAKIVFRANMTVHSALTYPTVYLVQYVLGVSLLYLLVDRFRVAKEIASLIVVAVSVPVTFVLSRIIISAGSPRREL